MFLFIYFVAFIFPGKYLSASRHTYLDEDNAITGQEFIGAELSFSNDFSNWSQEIFQITAVVIIERVV